MNNISQYLCSLSQNIFFGEFGLFTTAPRYLFGVLLPVMAFLELAGQVLSRFPILHKASPLVCRFLYGFMGLGCTTLALAASEKIPDTESRRHISLFLIFLVPCSAKLTIVAAFASLVTFRVFLVFLLLYLFFCLLLYAALCRLYPLSSSIPSFPENGVKEDFPRGFLGDFFRIFFKAFLRAFQSVGQTALPFLLGSVLLSLADFFGLFDALILLTAPLLKRLTGLPEEAAKLLFLGILKRDFAAAALLPAAEQGLFHAAQMVVLILMMLFSPPCFNSAVILAKQQKLPVAAAVWLGSLMISLIIGFLSSKILFITLL